jgi:FKBP-type peptidyl-prolyl cis-trans isomerase FkpA
MFKNKKMWMVVGAVAVLTLGGVGFIVSQSGKHQLSAQEAADAAATQVSSTASDPAPSNSATPLTGTPPTPPSTQASGGLQATNSGASGNLGQLNPAGPSASTQGQSSPNSSAGAAASNPFDPASFAQYDKYKNDQSALMGDPQVGTGATLEAGKTAVVYYRGWLTNGTLFDQSRAGSDGKLQPFSFTVGSHQVISGWEQGLVGMKVGGVRLLIVPPSVGYGASGQGSIPPNSLLVFQVQLVDVK